jgi:hypothetical protein
MRASAGSAASASTRLSLKPERNALRDALKPEVVVKGTGVERWYNMTGDSFPCGNYQWEVTMYFSPSTNIVSIPIVVKPGDVACAQ